VTKARFSASARLAGVLTLASLLAACAAERSPLQGAFDRPRETNANAPKVSVLFLFRHLSQQHGWDAIPKLQFTGVKDFDNLFRDALGEISNISSYETFTEMPDDVNSPKRREALAASRAAADYVIEIDFFEESSFKQQCLSGTISLLSLTLVPMPYDWDYTITTRIDDKGTRRVASYQRKATLTNWIETVLVFAYPFYPLDGKREEIFSQSLHDTFRQIDAEKVLK
jgi:hypothetical protein